MGMTFTTITGVAEVKVMALSAVISENKKKMKHIDDSFCCVVLNIFLKLSGGKNQFLIQNKTIIIIEYRTILPRNELLCQHFGGHR